jgi:hypothetical protein
MATERLEEITWQAKPPAPPANRFAAGVGQTVPSAEADVVFSGIARAQDL